MIDLRRCLVDAGISRDRLVAKGYGETRPVDAADVEDARARSRRVQFEIIELDPE